MAMAGTARAENTGSRMSGSIMKQPAFNWSEKDKYAELRNFILEVKNMIKIFNVYQTEMVSIIKKLARQARPTISRNPNTSRTRSMLGLRRSVQNTE